MSSGSKSPKLQNNQYLNLAMVWFFMAVFCILGYLMGGGITGYVIHQQTELTKQWDFANSAEYTYNDSLIDWGDGVRLVSETEIITIEDYDYENYYIAKALYNPNDKTDKLNALDDHKFEANKNDIFDFIFEERLDNGGIIHLYMESGNADEIFLCDLGNECESLGYGKVDYDGNEGWYNITISGLSEETAGFNINQDGGHAKFNHVYAAQNNEEISIAKALYNPNDKTDKLNALDDSKVEINKNKLLNIIFDNKIDSEDTVALYMKSGTASEIYICDYGTSCSSPGYGKVDYDGNEGWYNITISGLSSSTKYVNIDPDEAKFDYISAYSIINNSYAIENITYPNLATIDTEDVTVEDFYSWGILTVEESLNNQNINYYYSTNSGESWNLISNFNLSSVSSPTIRLRAELISDGTNTPILDSLTLNYLTSVACEEDWSCTEWSPEECPENEMQTRTCTDSNECGSEDNKPETTRSCEYCTESWVINYADCMINNTKLKYYTDENSCGTTNNIPADNNTYVECDYCTPAWNCAIYGACQSDDYQYCNTVTDNNSCHKQTSLSSDQYSGDYSEFIIACNYDNSPPEISNVLVTPTKGVVGIIVNISLSIDDENNISFAQAIISDSNNIIKKLSLHNNNPYTTTWNTANTTKGTYIIGINISDINSNNAYYKQIAAIALDTSAKGSFTNSSVPLIENQTTLINATETTGVVIEITSKGNLNASISAAQYSENLKDATPSKTALGKYLDIIVGDTTKNNITKAKIFIYYNDSEVNNANIDENTLRIYYYNESSGNWQILNSSVNTTSNYVSAELSHFSTYGIFGEQRTTQSSSSGGGGGYGRGSDSKSNIQIIPPNKEEVKTKEIIKPPEATEEKPISCSYSLNIDFPKKISFAETDTIKGFVKNDGNCDIDEVDLYLNKELTDLAFFENPTIDKIDIGKTKEIYLKVNKPIIEKTKIFGFAVKPVEKVIKGYSGELIGEGITNNTIVIQKKIALNVDILLPSEEVTLNPLLFLALTLIGLIMVIFKRRIKFREKPSNQKN